MILLLTGNIKIQTPPLLSMNPEYSYLSSFIITAKCSRQSGMASYVIDHPWSFGSVVSTDGNRVPIPATDGKVFFKEIAHEGGN